MVVLIGREIRLEMREIPDSDAWPVRQPRGPPCGHRPMRPEVDTGVARVLRWILVRDAARTHGFTVLVEDVGELGRQVYQWPAKLHRARLCACAGSFVLVPSRIHGNNKHGSAGLSRPHAPDVVVLLHLTISTKICLRGPQSHICGLHPLSAHASWGECLSRSSFFLPCGVWAGRVAC